MKRIDYSSICDNVSGQVLNLVSKISNINGKEEFWKLQYPDVFDSLINISLTKTLKSSNSIGGINVCEDRLNKIISGYKPKTSDEKQILGYKQVLEEISKNYEKIELNEETVLRFHSIMMGNNKISGKYQQTDNQIVEVDKNGNKRVLFVPQTEKETKELMNRWFASYNKVVNDPNINPLVLIPCAIVDFLCIRPFSDGNGRLSRLLMVLMLYKNGIDIDKYISIDNQINNTLSNYYESIRRCNDNNTYEAFVLYFLETIYECYKKLNDKFITNSFRKLKKNERIENVIVNSTVPLSKESLKDYLPDVSVRSIEATLDKLLKEKKIVKIGSTKNARYMKK